MRAGNAWHLGSIGKAMTATIAAALVEAGASSWDATLGELLPELADAMHESFRTATLRQLLDHRAGLPRHETAGGDFARELDPDDDESAHRLVIAAALLARERLFQPLRMTGASFGVPHDVVGHTELLGKLVALPASHPLASHPNWYGPAGDVHAPLGDLAAFAHRHFDEDLRAMHEPVAGADYACGFQISSAPWADGPVLAHDGSSRGWHASIRIAPRSRRAILVAYNRGGEAGAAACADAMTTMAGLWRGELRR